MLTKAKTPHGHNKQLLLLMGQQLKISKRITTWAFLGNFSNHFLGRFSRLERNDLKRTSWGLYYKTLWNRTYGHSSVSWHVKILNQDFCYVEKELAYLQSCKFCPYITKKKFYSIGPRIECLQGSAKAD